MKKNLIAIIALTAALAASTSAFADTGNSRRHYAFEW